MKSVNELLDDLATELQSLKWGISAFHQWRFDRAQQLVGYIRQKLRDTKCL